MNRFLKLAVLPLLLAIGLTFETSDITASLGDTAFAKNQFTKASAYYRISQVTNPFRKDIQPKMTTIAHITASQSNTLAENTANNKIVLGASTQKNENYIPNFFEVILNKLFSLFTR